MIHFSRFNKKEHKIEDEFDLALKMVLEFKRLFLDEELRYMPIITFIQFDHTDSILKDFKTYRKSAIYVMEKLNNPLKNDIIKLAVDELNISINNEWKYTPLLMNQYYVLQGRAKDVLELSIKNNENLVLCAFIISIHNEILDYKYNVGKYTP